MLKKFAAAGILTAATAGALMLAGPANADVNTNGTGNIVTPIKVPVNVQVPICGNDVQGFNVPILSPSSAGCHGDATFVHGGPNY